MEWDSAVVGIRGNVYNWLSFGIVGNSVCRTWESCTLAFPCAVNRVIHDSIASYAHFHNASFVPPGAGLPPLTDFSFRLVAFLSLPPCPLLVGFLPAVCRKPFRFLRGEKPRLFPCGKFPFFCLAFLIPRLCKLL